MKRQLIALGFALCTAVAAAQDHIKVVYHVNTGVETAAAILSNISNELNASPTDRIVVVTHGPGIDFLLNDAKDSKGREFSGQVSALAGRGVEFKVCNNTLQTRHIDAANLLMETQIVPSGVAEVARLQAREGFVYLKP
ncbi:DsrE family protein [Comamonas guangdongensis]|uniref:DsrE family protein n=1 Tax=Comamonas guangdongensis TaxID=510515 RepID=A0ABV3ZVI9_9BURK